MKVAIEGDLSPSKIVCVGRNYADHAAELGNSVPSEPLLFLKAPSAVIITGDPVKLPAQSVQVEHEGELGVVISTKCSNLADTDDVKQYIKGYTCFNDVTARDIQRHDVQFTRGKSFDTFCPVGPWIETDLDPSDLRVICRVNGEIKQDGRTSQMVFPVDFLVRYISRQMTLVPGDLIATGTPTKLLKRVFADSIVGSIDPVMSTAKTMSTVCSILWEFAFNWIPGTARPFPRISTSDCFRSVTSVSVGEQCLKHMLGLIAFKSWLFKFHM